MKKLRATCLNTIGVARSAWRPRTINTATIAALEAQGLDKILGGGSGRRRATAWQRHSLRVAEEGGGLDDLTARWCRLTDGSHGSKTNQSLREQTGT